MRTNPTVETSTDGQVVFVDCAVENSTEYDLDGDVSHSNEHVVFHYRVVMVLEEGAWKAAEFRHLSEPCSP